MAVETSRARKGVGIAGAIAAILAAVAGAEGGFVNNPADPGGATNHGVTEKVARQSGFTGDMRALSQEQANAILAKGYITGPGFDLIIRRSVALGEEITDTGVNMGPSRPSRWLQVALNALNRQGRDWPDVAEDGAIGPGTMAAYDALARKRGEVKACELAIKLLDAQQGAEYLRLVKANPKLETFMAGWADTRLGNVPVSRCAEGGAE